MRLPRSMRATALALPLAAALSAGTALPANALPPGIPDPNTAKTQLGELTVAPEGSMDGYSREQFPTWNEAPDHCDTRESVLKRDGENVQVGSDCYPTSGSWTSAYDGASWRKASDLDIDHVVPLAAAWRSGADQWSIEQRQQFANDLEGTQLIAVTDNVNQDKSDRTPDKWMPPKADFACSYASMYVAAKHEWKLTVTDAEKAALDEALGTC